MPAAETAGLPAGAGPEPAQGNGAPAPVFDLVRVDPQGTAIVAGTATPGAVVSILVGEIVRASATADAEGKFVVIFDAPAAREPQALLLVATDPAGTAPVRSQNVVLLLPPATGTETATTAPAPAPDGVAATAMVRDGVVEVTPTEGAAEGEARDIVLGAITYGDKGTLAVTGLGTAGAVLRAYVDDRPAAEATVDPGGRWTLDLTTVPPGLHQLRIDQLAPSGGVQSRIETPFRRDTPHTPADASGNPAPDAPGQVTVQPGNNLWTLAKIHYGEGTLYTQIFTANDGLLRDPNLIYPGQVLDLPALPPASPAAPQARP